MKSSFQIDSRFSLLAFSLIQTAWGAGGSDDKRFQSDKQMATSMKRCFKRLGEGA